MNRKERRGMASRARKQQGPMLKALRQEIVNAAIVCGVETDVANAWMYLAEEVFMDVVTLELGEDKCGEVLAHLKGPQ